MKRCGTCLEDFDETNFYVRRASKDGLCHICKLCAKKKSIAWSANNKGRRKLQLSQIYALNKEAIKERSKRWRLKNPERRKEIIKKSALAAFQRNPEKIRAQQRQWHHNRRARILSTGSIKKDDVLVLMGLFEFKTCLYCGQSSKEALVLDHFVPLSRGGANEIGNILPVCRSCNAKKYNKMPQDWVRERCGDNGYGEICWFLDFTKDALNPGITFREYP